VCGDSLNSKGEKNGFHKHRKPVFFYPGTDVPPDIIVLAVRR